VLTAFAAVAIVGLARHFRIALAALSNEQRSRFVHLSGSGAEASVAIGLLLKTGTVLAKAGGLSKPGTNG